MDFDKLSKQFLTDDEASPERLGELIQRMLPHCSVRKDGAVIILDANLSGIELVKLILSARFVASRLKGSAVNPEVTVKEIADYAGLPTAQAAARAKETVDEKFAERCARGTYRARQHKLSEFVARLSESPASKKEE